MINIQVLKVMFNKMDSCIKMNRGGINLFYRIRYGMGIVWNYLRYKATISDYFELRFFEKNSKEKKEYLTSKDGCVLHSMSIHKRFLLSYAVKKKCIVN